MLGFACIFTVAGIAIGLFIQSLQVGLDALRIVGGGVAVIVMGLHTAGVIAIPLLYRQAKLDDGSIASGSVVSSFLIGVFFAAGWSPCVGTILTGIFALSTADGPGRTALSSTRWASASRSSWRCCSAASMAGCGAATSIIASSRG